MSSQSSNRVVLFTALAWGAGLFGINFALHLAFHALNEASKNTLDSMTGGYLITLLFGPPIAGAFAAYWTVRLLKRRLGLPSMRPVPVMLVWAVGMLFSMLSPLIFDNLFYFSQSPIRKVYSSPYLLFLTRDVLLWMVPALLGGLALAGEIRRAGLRLGGREVLLAAAGWAVGFGLANGLVTAGFNQMSLSWFSLRDPGWVVIALLTWLRYGVVGLAGGAIGAWATLLAARLHSRAPEPGLPSAQAHNA